ncbi:MAG: DUF1573 domain-containing protein [Candidatus Azobacteroides sp.]|nr:DUF1573 domain-containing protein [Candidatus Azobacteroides sp.]
MSEFLIYLLKLNFIFSVLFAFYYWILRKETFYTCNRVYALTVAVLSLLLPVIDGALFFHGHPTLFLPPAIVPSDIQVSGNARGLSVEDCITGFIIIGIALLVGRLLIQLISLWRFKKQTSEGIIHGIRVRIFNERENPFSFFHWIFINPAIHPDVELDEILTHEQVHVQQYHTIDILLYEAFTIFCWYNPLVWLMKQYVKQNIEFIADRQVLKAGHNKYNYQRSLLKANQISGFSLLATGLNINNLPVRLAMMNKQSSPTLRLLNYALLVPICLGIFFCINIHAEKLPVKSIINSGNAVSTEAGITIAFDKYKHDFGTIRESDGKVSTVFTFTNLGDSPLIISKVEASCGCTTPEWTREPVAPGGQGYIKATYDPTNRIYFFERSLTVYSNGNPSKIVLSIQGTAINQ